MSSYKIYNLLDLIDSVGEEKVQSILCDFSCPLNKEIENFASRNAIDFSKKKISITYLIMDNDYNVVSLFTLAHKIIDVNCSGFSNTTKKKLKKYADANGLDNTLSLSAFLMAQLGKNYRDNIESPDGNRIVNNPRLKSRACKSPLLIRLRRIS